MWWHRSTRKPLVEVGPPQELVRVVLVVTLRRMADLFMHGFRSFSLWCRHGEIIGEERGKSRELSGGWPDLGSECQIQCLGERKRKENERG